MYSREEEIIMAMKMKKYEELELRDDYMFSRIMSDPEFVKPLLETILGVKIRKIVYPQTQKTIDLSLRAKGIRLDVYVEDDQNTVFNLEMQTSDNRNLPKRMRYYQGVIDLNILDKGQDYTTLKKSYVIFICTFDPFGEDRHIYTYCNTIYIQISVALTITLCYTNIVGDERYVGNKSLAAEEICSLSYYKFLILFFDCPTWLCAVHNILCKFIKSYIG